MSRVGDPGADDFGTLERAGDHTVLRYLRRLAHPRQKVWRALTEDEHLAAWFPTAIEGTRTAGSRLHFWFREGEGEPFDGQMLAYDPPSLMELRWADDILRFELEPDGPGCILRLTVTFPEYGKAARDAAGWHVCLEQLTHVLDGTPRLGSRRTAGAWSTVAMSSASGRGVSHRATLRVGARPRRR